MQVLSLVNGTQNISVIGLQKSNEFISLPICYSMILTPSYIHILEILLHLKDTLKVQFSFKLSNPKNHVSTSVQWCDDKDPDSDKTITTL